MGSILDQIGVRAGDLLPDDKRALGIGPGAGGDDHAVGGDQGDPREDRVLLEEFIERLLDRADIGPVQDRFGAPALPFQG